VLDFTHAHGVMIGRGAHGAPWIFRDVNSFLESKEIPPQLLRTQIRDIILNTSRRCTLSMEKRPAYG
jgi:tRNA-dihydrouridine synthase B